MNKYVDNFGEKYYDISYLNGLDLDQFLESIDAVFGELTLENCKIIAEAILEENKKDPHMIPPIPEQLLNDANENGGFILKCKMTGEIIGFIKLTIAFKDKEKPENNIYERGSLIVMEKYRNKGYGDAILRIALDIYSNKCMFSVTNNDIVKHALTKLNQTKITRDEMTDDFKQLVDGPQEPCQGDEVFANPKFMKTHKITNSLQKNITSIEYNIKNII